MEHIKERIHAVFARAGYPNDFVERFANIVTQPESPELETFINEFDETTQKVVATRNEFIDKFVKPKVDEVSDKSFKAIRGAIFAKVANKTGLTNEEIAAILNANDKKFAESIIALVDNIVEKKANYDELTKAEIKSLKDKEEQLTKLLEQAKDDADKAEKRSLKAENDFLRKGFMVDAFGKLAPMVVGNPDLVKQILFDQVQKIYDIDPQNGKLYYKGSDKLAFAPNTAKELTLADVMYDILDKNQFLIKKNLPEETPAKEQNPQKSNLRFFKEQ